MGSGNQLNRSPSYPTYSWLHDISSSSSGPTPASPTDIVEVIEANFPNSGIVNDVGVSPSDDIANSGRSVQGMSMAVLMLIVVASLSLVVGAIYMLIYFKSIKPMTARSRSYVEQGGKQDEEAGRSKSAHPFFRRK